MSKQQQAKELIIKGRPNLPDGPASAITPEYRAYLKEQHPDDLAILLNLEKEAGIEPDNNPQPKVTPQAEPVKEAAEAPNDPTSQGKGKEAENNGN